MAHIPYDDLVTWKKLPKAIRDKISIQSLEDQVLAGEEEVEKKRRVRRQVLQASKESYEQEEISNRLTFKELCVLLMDLLEMDDEEIADFLINSTPNSVAKLRCTGRQKLNRLSMS